MALNSKILQTTFYTIFETLNGIYSNGDEYLALNVATAIGTYVSSGTVTTNDTGLGSIGGAYVGVGQGTMTINVAMLSGLLLTSFKLKSINPILASNIAMNIDSVCRLPNTVKTDSHGSSTIPSSTPYADGGKGNGTFTSTPTLISSRLSACFSQMDSMYEGGNLYLSQEWATAIDTYFRSATINVTLQPPPTMIGVVGFGVVGTGVGKIS